MDFVCVAAFLFPDEAAVAAGALRGSGILCYLANDRTLTAVWAWNYALGGIRLMVPLTELESAQAVLMSVGPTSAGSTTGEAMFRDRRLLRRLARVVLSVCILLSPTGVGLHLFYFPK